MRYSNQLAVAVSLAATVMGVACGPAEEGDSGDTSPADATPVVPDAAVDAAVAPVFRNPVDTPDDALAAAALSLLGAPVEGSDENCNACHGLTRQSLRQWRALADTAVASCLTDLEVSEPEAARTMIDCLRSDPADPESVFAAAKLGVYSSGAHLDWFAYVFRLAYGEEGAAEHADFVARVGMPRGEHAPFTQGDFDIVAEYFVRGLPLLDDILPNDPRPEDCTAGVSADVAAHVDQMSVAGWKAQNSERGMLMFGCGGAGSPRECLADAPRVEDWEGMAGVAVRRLRDVTYTSAYWTRSSADGRFVGHGTNSGGFNAAFVDLQTDAVIPADAFYDPGFFPDNSGFAFQSDSAFFCEQSVLTSGPDEVTFNEPGCSQTNQVGLYQHLGAALDGGDYWTVDGQFVSDDGGDGLSFDPEAAFSSDSRARLTPMIHTGSQFEPTETVQVETRYEGDAVLSPSARLLVSRVAGTNDQQLGYVLRRLDATSTPGGYVIEATEIARYCANGGKPGFSFDERWMAYHHYVEDSDAVELGFTGPADPAFAAYRDEGASNVYLLDLLTGESTRVTRMAPGEFALYPHFRSDGWIYFMVRKPGPGETIAATDAALVLAE